MQNYKIYLRRNNITQVIYADENVYASLSSLFPTHIFVMLEN